MSRWLVQNDPLVASAASMDKQPFFLKGGEGFAGADGHSTRSAQKFILSIVKRCVSSEMKHIESLVESLVWPFVARRSQREIWFTQKELDRFVHSMRKTAVNLQSVVSEDNREQSFIKYWTDRYLCQVFSDTKRKDSFPDAEGWMDKTPLFVGWCKRFIARAVVRRDVAFFYSLQKGVRRMWPALGDLKKEKALRKHAERLSTFKGFVGEELEEVISSVSAEVSRLANSSATKFMPSGSACLQASRRKGGALGLFKRMSQRNSHESEKIGKLPVFNAHINQWRRETFSEAYDHCIERSGETRDGCLSLLEVSVVAIPEPGKFRIISKGDGYLYSALQPLQGLMLDAWKRHPASTMRDEDLLDRVRLVDRLDFPFWISVDYEAATDLLKRDATYTAFRRFEKLPFFDLGWYSLGPGLVRYPDGSVVEGIEGQLMGHPLSFPLLCIINLAVYRLSVEKWVDRDRKRRLRLLDALMEGVLVNGDDMLFKGDEELFEIFSEVSAQAGFKKSQGKNYVSPDCCMINSQVFRRVQGRMERFGYLNMKLVKGVSLKTGESAAVPTQIGKELSKMVSLCHWSACAVPTAMARWEKDWKGLSPPNWYLPVCLGGYGLDPRFGPPKIHVTRSQRLLAARFVNDPQLSLYRGGMSKAAVKAAGALANWRVVPGFYVQTESETSMKETDDAWLARIAYGTRAQSGVTENSEAVVARWRLARADFRLKPMSMDGIDRYWDAQIFASKLPICPPIGVIGRREMHQVQDPEPRHWFNEAIVAAVRGDGSPKVKACRQKDEPIAVEAAGPFVWTPEDFDNLMRC